MDYKDLVKAGHNRIVNDYLAAQTRSREQIRLLDNLASRLPEEASRMDAGCGAGVPVIQILSAHFDVTGLGFSEAQIELSRRNCPMRRRISP